LKNNVPSAPWRCLTASEEYTWPYLVHLDSSRHGASEGSAAGTQGCSRISQTIFFFFMLPRKNFCPIDLLFSFRLLCSELVSFVSSVLKCLKVSQNGPKWLFLSLSVFFCLIMALKQRGEVYMPLISAIFLNFNEQTFREEFGCQEDD